LHDTKPMKNKNECYTKIASSFQKNEIVEGKTKKIVRNEWSLMNLFISFNMSIISSPQINISWIISPKVDLFSSIVFSTYHYNKKKKHNLSFNLEEGYYNLLTIIILSKIKIKVGRVYKPKTYSPYSYVTIHYRLLNSKISIGPLTALRNSFNCYSTNLLSYTISNHNLTILSRFSEV
jgi:hypothetical protein